MIAVLSLLVTLTAQTPTAELTFVRHGETQANATGRYNARTLNSFSSLGVRQVAELAGKLPPRFDRILASPSPRVLYTIAPYLRRTGQRAVIWPLLYECCSGRRPHNAHPTSFKYGGRCVVPEDLKGLFVLMPGEERLPVSPDYNSGLAQVEQSVREFRSRFSRGTVLLAGHSGQGGHFIHEVTGRWIKLANAQPVRLDLKVEGRARTPRLPPS